MRMIFFNLRERIAARKKEFAYIKLSSYTMEPCRSILALVQENSGRQGYISQFFAEIKLGLPLFRIFLHQAGTAYSSVDFFVKDDFERITCRS